MSVSAHPDGTTTVGVTAANLQDAFVDLEIDGAVSPGPTTEAAPGGRMLALDDCEGTVGLGTVSLGWDVDWGGGTFKYSLRHRMARLEAYVTPTVDVTIGVSGAFACSIEPPEWLLAVVGPVTFDAEVTLDFEVSAAASGTLTSGFPITIGFDYSNGDTIDLSSFDATGGGTFSSTSEDAAVSVSGAMTAAFDGKAFGLAGFEIGVGPKLTGSWQPPNCFELSADIGVGLSAEIGRWGIDWNIAIAEYRSPKFVLADFGSDECDKGIGNPAYVSGLVRYDVDTDAFDEIPLPGGGTTWRHNVDAFGSMTFRLDPGGGSYSGELDWTYSYGCDGSPTAPSLHIVGSDTDMPGTDGYQPPYNSGDGWYTDPGDWPPLLTQVATNLCDGTSATTEQHPWGPAQAGLCGDLFVEDLEGVPATAKAAEGTIAGGGGDNYGEGTSYRCKVTYRITADDDADHDGIPDDADATPNAPDPLPS